MYDGYWLYGGIDLVTNVDNKENYYNGVSVGSAGIGMYFLNLFKATNNTQYLFPVNKIISQLNTHAIEINNSLYWTAQIKGKLSNKIYTGFSLGSAGIGKFYTHVYNSFGDYNRTKEMILIIENFFQLIKNSSAGLIPNI